MFYLSLILNVHGQNTPADSHEIVPAQVRPLSQPLPLDFKEAPSAEPAPVEAAPGDPAIKKPAQDASQRVRPRFDDPELSRSAHADPSPVDSSINLAPIEIHFHSYKEREKLESLAIDGRIISTKWREGKELIYDCETMTFVCVDGFGKIACLEQSASAASYPELYKGCVPLKTLDTLHLCTLEQVKMIDKAISSRAIGCK